MNRNARIWEYRKRCARRLVWLIEQDENRDPETYHAEEYNSALDLICKTVYLASANHRLMEADNDPRNFATPRAIAELDHKHDLWNRRCEVIDGMWADYGLHLTWPGTYPCVTDCSGRDFCFIGDYEM